MTMFDVYEVDKYGNEFFDSSFKHEVVADSYAKDKTSAYAKTNPEAKFVVRERNS